MNRLLIIVALVLAGCGSNPPAPAPVIEYRTQVVNTACSSFKKITGHPSDLATMSPDVKAQILAHNQAWDQACKK